MLKARKIWIGLSLVTTVASVQAGNHFAVDMRLASALAAAQKNAFPGGSFSEALSKVLAGEGGESGIGTTYKAGAITIPALGGAQISQALTGNTLRRDEAFALHFKGDGKFSGWESKWEKVDALSCAKAKGDSTYDVEEGQCQHRVDTRISDGRWSVNNNALCTQPVLGRVAGGNECTSVFLVLDDIALFDKSGKMIGKPIHLVKGQQLERQSPQ